MGAWELGSLGAKINVGTNGVRPFPWHVPTIIGPSKYIGRSQDLAKTNKLAS